MKARFAVAAVAAALLSTAAIAQMGPGMMGGQGMGQGMGPGMMGGRGDCPQGPGMMGGRGMMGHGMMGGHAMGHGMMGGRMHAALASLNLTDEQRAKVTEIRRDLQRKNYALMGSLRDLRWQAEDAAKSAELDEAAARKRYDAGAAIRKQMFEARLDAHKRIEAVLTQGAARAIAQGMDAGRPAPRWSRLDASRGGSRGSAGRPGTRGANQSCASGLFGSGTSGRHCILLSRQRVAVQERLHRVPHRDDRAGDHVAEVEASLEASPPYVLLDGRVVGKLGLEIHGNLLLGDGRRIRG